MSGGSDSSGFWIVLAGLYFASGFFGGDDPDTALPDLRPVAAQVAPEPTVSMHPEPPEDPWDPDKVLYSAGVTEPDVLFKDTFAGVKDPFAD